MAKINGVQIKSLKTFKGHDGEPLYQGNVYLNGKLLGFWSQNYHGGICDDFDFDESLLKEVVNKMKSIQTDENSKEYYDTTSFMFDLIDLIEFEKEYKKSAKKFKTNELVVVIVTDGYNRFVVSIPGKSALNMSKDEILSEYKTTFENIRKQLFANEEEKIYIFKSLNDFNVTKK